MSNILHLSEGVYLAIHGLVVIKNVSPNKINVKKISNILNASENHLAKVFKKLSNASIITSTRGPQGGFSLNKNATDITILDVIEAVEGDFKFTKCPFGKTKCIFDGCILGSEFNNKVKEFYEIYKNVTIADLEKKLKKTM